MRLFDLLMSEVAPVQGPPTNGLRFPNRSRLASPAANMGPGVP